MKNLTRVLPQQSQALPPEQSLATREQTAIAPTENRSAAASQSDKARLPPASHFKKHFAPFFAPSRNMRAPALPAAHWARSLNLSKVKFPEGVVAPKTEDVIHWITELCHAPGELKKRYSVGAGLYFHKPSSPRYQFAKHQMDANARTQLTAVLRQLIEQQTDEQQTLTVEARNEVVDLYLALQHARLRTHTPEARAEQRRNYLRHAIVGVAGVPFAWGGVITGIVALQLSRVAHRHYYRSEVRPEYQESIVDMCELLASSNLLEEVKLKIAGEILDRYIRSEKLLRTAHSDSILLNLNGNIFPAGVVMRGAPDGDRRAEGMTSRILRSPSTVEQKRHLIKWAKENVDSINLTEFEQTLKRVYKNINALLHEKGSPPLVPSPDLKTWSSKKNAAAFKSLLERAERDSANIVKNRKAEVYHNVAVILDAMKADPTFVETVFDNSVGGTQHCINNAMEYISDLATRGRNRRLVRQIESGSMGLDEFKEACLSNFKLGILEQYIAENLLPEAIRKYPELKGTNEPELSQVIKSDLKDTLGLPDTVNPSTAAYQGKRRLHQGFLTRAQGYVSEFTGDLKNQQAFLGSDPLWRDGIIALARREGKIQDLEKLHTYAAGLSNYILDDEVLIDNEGQQVNNTGLESAVRAWTELIQFYRPRTGQKVLNVGGQGHDKYTTEIAAFQDLYDRIEFMEKQFRTASQSIESQFVSHATTSILKHGAFPEDGGFEPHFALPENWASEMELLASKSRAAQLVELSTLFQKREEDIKRLNQEIDTFVDNGQFSDKAFEKSSLDQNQRRQLVAEMRSFYNTAPLNSRPFNLRAYLEQLTPEPTGTQSSSDKPLPDDLLHLRTKLVEARAAEQANALSYPELSEPDTSVFNRAIKIQQDELEAFSNRLFNQDSSKGLASFSRNEVQSVRKNIEDFYADQGNWEKRFELDWLIKPGGRKRKRDIPAGLVAFRDKVRAVAQARHEYAKTLERLENLKAPAIVTTGLESLPFAMRMSPEPPVEHRSDFSAGLAIEIDPRASAAIHILDRDLSATLLEPVSVEEAAAINANVSSQRAFTDDFDPETGEPTDAYVNAMTANAMLARGRLEEIGLETGEASGAGNNCLIHSILDGLGITGDDNTRLARDLRQDLINRLADRGETLNAFEYLNTFGSHPANLIDLINERFPEADVGMRIYTPLPGGGLHFNNPDSVGGTANQDRTNTVAVIWVGNHFEPIKTIQPKAD